MLSVGLTLVQGSRLVGHTIAHKLIDASGKKMRNRKNSFASRDCDRLGKGRNNYFFFFLLSIIFPFKYLMKKLKRKFRIIGISIFKIPILIYSRIIRFLYFSACDYKTSKTAKHPELLTSILTSFFAISHLSVRVRQRLSSLNISFCKKRAFVYRLYGSVDCETTSILSS